MALDDFLSDAKTTGHDFLIGFWQTGTYLNFSFFHSSMPHHDSLSKKVGGIGEVLLVEYGGFFALWCLTDVTYAAALYYGGKAATNCFGYVADKRLNSQKNSITS